MSVALYGIESLRFYSEEEIEIREMLVKRLAYVVERSLSGINPAWKFERMEGPLLTPRSQVSSSYNEDDIFVTQVKKANEELVLRPETTASNYLYAQHASKLRKLPVCVWQVGKSFRVEKSDGATAAKLRFNEFYQQEFQCIYSITTKVDYRDFLISNIVATLAMIMGTNKIRVVDSDRLPPYSESTKDIELIYNGDWKEVASCSIRTDYAPDIRVCEIALGIDRLVEIYNKNEIKHFNEVQND